MSGTLVISDKRDEKGGYNSTVWDVHRRTIKSFALVLLPSFREISEDLAKCFESTYLTSFADISAIDRDTFNRFVDLIESITVNDELEHEFMVLRYLLYMDHRYEGEFDLPSGEIHLPENKVWRAKGWVFQLLLSAIHELARRRLKLILFLDTPSRLGELSLKRAGTVWLERIYKAKEELTLDLTPLNDAEEWFISGVYPSYEVMSPIVGGRSPEIYDEFYPAVQELFDLLHEWFEEVVEKWLHIMIEDGDLN